MDHVRLSHPQDYVRVSVVLKEFSLKVSRRPPGKDLPLYHYPDLLRLPNEALDISVRKVPEGLRMLKRDRNRSNEFCSIKKLKLEKLKD